MLQVLCKLLKTMFQNHCTCATGSLWGQPNLLFVISSWGSNKALQSVACCQKPVPSILKWLGRKKVTSAKYDKLHVWSRWRSCQVCLSSAAVQLSVTLLFELLGCWPFRINLAPEPVGLKFKPWELWRHFRRFRGYLMVPEVLDRFGRFEEG